MTLGGVLDGITVLDHGCFITGPFAAMLLADMGARVIKIERPGTGDPFRSFETGLYGPQFRAFNRNKESIALDHAEAADRQLLDDLAAAADVFIHNFRPGVARRLGIDADRLQRLNPALIHCAITGFGEDGPDAARAAYDTVAQAASGYLSLFVGPGDTAIKGPAVADVVSGLYAAYGVLGALFERERTGRGRLVEVSMLSAMAHFASEPFQHFFERGTPPAPVHRSEISQSFAFECADGRLIAVHLSSPEKFWDGLLAAIERPDLAADARFAARAARIRNHAALQAALAPEFCRRTLPELCARLTAHDVPHAPVHRLDEVLESPQARHLGIAQRATHPSEGVVRAIANPVIFDRARPAGFAPPPVLDEHGGAIRDGVKRPADPSGGRPG